MNNISDLVFATHNLNKYSEICQILPNQKILNLHDLGVIESIPETGTTLIENALIKAEFVYKNFNKNCFADDTGLEVESLNGKPGVYSARFAGEDGNSKANIELLLSMMEKIKNRKAQFKTIIALILEGKNYFFEGIVKGSITKDARGERGFGYDPVFIPDGYTVTFAEMSAQEKNKISHRAIALKKLTDFLK